MKEPVQRGGENKPTLRLRTTDAGPLIVVARNNIEIEAARFCGLNFAYEPPRSEYGLGFVVNKNGTVSILVRKDHALRMAVMSPFNYSIV